MGVHPVTIAKWAGRHRSVIAEVNVSPTVRRLGLYFGTETDGLYAADKVGEFLRDLLKHPRGQGFRHGSVLGGARTGYPMETRGPVAYTTKGSPSRSRCVRGKKSPNMCGSKVWIGITVFGFKAVTSSRRSDV